MDKQHEIDCLQEANTQQVHRIEELEAELASTRLDPPTPRKGELKIPKGLADSLDPQVTGDIGESLRLLKELVKHSDQDSPEVKEHLRLVQDISTAVVEMQAENAKLKAVVREFLTPIKTVYEPRHPDREGIYVKIDLCKRARAIPGVMK